MRVVPADDEVGDALSALKRSDSAAAEAVDRLFDRLQDPDYKGVRTFHAHGESLYGETIPPADEILVLWKTHPVVTDVRLVIYIGPDLHSGRPVI